MRFGAFLRSAFGRPKQSPEAVARIKLWARTVLQLPDDTALTVSEIVCNDPACPGVETVILILQPGRKTRACKIVKALEDVTEHDLRQALEG